MSVSRLAVLRTGLRPFLGGDLNQRLQVGGDDEVARLAVAVNRFAARAGEVEAQLRADQLEEQKFYFFGATEIQNALSAMTSCINSSERPGIEILRKSASELRSVLEGVFEYCYLSYTDFQPPIEPLSIVDLLYEEESYARFRFPQRSFSLQLVENDRSIRIEPSTLSRVIRFVLQIVCETSPSSSAIVLSLDNFSSSYRIWVFASDSGSAEMKPFQPLTIDDLKAMPPDLPEPFRRLEFLALSKRCAVGGIRLQVGGVAGAGLRFSVVLEQNTMTEERLR